MKQLIVKALIIAMLAMGAVSAYAQDGSGSGDGGDITDVLFDIVDSSTDTRGGGTGKTMAAEIIASGISHSK